MNRAKLLRIMKGDSVQKTANNLNWNDRTIANIERNLEIRKPLYKTLVAYADYLGCKPNELFDEITYEDILAIRKDDYEEDADPKDAERLVTERISRLCRDYTGNHKSA